MDKKKLAKEVCDAITTGEDDIALKVFTKKKGSVFMIKFEVIKITCDKEFIKHVQDLVEN